jgi:hypothetical protein
MKTRIAALLILAASAWTFAATMQADARSIFRPACHVKPIVGGFGWRATPCIPPLRNPLFHLPAYLGGGGGGVTIQPPPGPR